MKDLILGYIASHGYLTIFIAFFIEMLGIPNPGQTILLYIGYLSYEGQLSWILSILTVGAGASLGISVSYWLGLKIGSTLIIRYGGYAGLSQERFKKAGEWAAVYGRKIIVVAYFIPALRHVNGYLCGAMEMPYPSFAVHAYAGAFLYAAVFISLGRELGPGWEVVLSAVRENITLAALVLLIFLVLRIVIKYRRHIKTR